MPRKPIITEQLLQAEVADVLTTTQRPYMRNKWDLRISELGFIDDRLMAIEPRHYIYWTPLGPRRTAHGTGVMQTVYDELKKTTVTTSSFKSNRSRALIQSGSGQQKLKATPDGTQLKTSFDYEVGWGVFGRILDRLIIHPTLQWATAYSSDALRIWLNHGVHPMTLRMRTIVQAFLHSLVLISLLLLPALHSNSEAQLTLLLITFVAGTGAWLNSADLPRARNSQPRSE